MENRTKILIVEDEILIARSIEKYLVKKGYQIVGIAISYEEAIVLYEKEKPDLTLLDIRLYGEKTGLDVAVYIRKRNPQSPFVFLTSQMDKNTLIKARETFPAGYLSKPIHKESLYTTIEVATYKYESESEKIDFPSITLFDGTTNHNVIIEDILYLQIDHIYVKVYLKNSKVIIQRSALKDLLNLLSKEQFIQTHRSYAINIHNVSSWNNEEVYINNVSIPISRSRKKTVHSYLKSK